MQTCPTSQISMLTVSTSRVETRARKDLPCRVKNAPRQSMRHCVEEYYQKKTECRFPWGDKDKLGNLIECNSTTGPVLFADFLDDLPKSKQGLFKLTGCHHQCEYLVSNGFLDKDFPTNNYVLLIFFYFGLQYRHSTRRLSCKTAIPAEEPLAMLLSSTWWMASQEKERFWPWMRLS